MDEEYAEAVLDLVEQVPAGRAMTYGTVAEVVADGFVLAGGRARGGPRQVGAVLARMGARVPWWRVVNAAGHPHDPARALAHYAAEGTPLTSDGQRVALRRAIWFPDDPED
ncbi:MGMT family protein [Cellulomonas sp. P22]|uniref:MGMT family protein n=1 Tax=Cellulomonas sp. P22 TaxID=3373189 RepID=UPI00378F65A5